MDTSQGLAGRVLLTGRKRTDHEMSNGINREVSRPPLL